MKPRSSGRGYFKKTIMKILIIGLLFMAAYGIKELYFFAVWITESDDDEQIFDDEHDNIHARKIVRDGFVYYSPIENESENDVFEWHVNRFRVEGERIKHDINYGKTNFDFDFDRIDGLLSNDAESI